MALREIEGFPDLRSLSIFNGAFGPKIENCVTLITPFGLRPMNRENEGKGPGTIYRGFTSEPLRMLPSLAPACPG